MAEQQDISNRDLLLAMHADMKLLVSSSATLTERVNNVAQKIDDHIDDDKHKHEVVDKRLAAHDNWRSRVMGIVTVVGAALGFIGAVAKDAIAAAWPWGH